VNTGSEGKGRGKGKKALPYFFPQIGRETVGGQENEEKEKKRGGLALSTCEEKEKMVEPELKGGGKICLYDTFHSIRKREKRGGRKRIMKRGEKA